MRLRIKRSMKLAHGAALLGAGLASLIVPARLAASRPVQVPGWVKQAAALPARTYPPRTDAEVLLDETNITMTSPDEYVENTRAIARILRNEGREYANCAADFRSGDKVLSAHAWAIDPSGHEFEAGEKDFSEHGRVTESLYDDIRILAAPTLSSAAGTVVACDISVRKHAFYPQHTWIPQNRVPTRIAVFTLSMPAGWEFKESWTSGDADKPETTGANAWRWEKHDLPGIELDEQHRPAFAAIAQRMSLAYFYPSATIRTSSWNAIGAWQFDLAADRHAATPEIKEKVQQLIAGKADFDSRLRALTEFLQSEIRYVDIEIGLGGWQPHPAAAVFHSRYGDCKDKANLLATMLQEAGISSNLAAIHTDHGVIRPDAPEVGFNHVILAIALPPEAKSERYASVVTTHDGNRYLLFDPTDQYTPVGLVRSELQGNYALLSRQHDSELVQAPMLKPELNRLERVGHFKLTPQGELIGDLRETRVGDQAMTARYLAVQRSDSERLKALERLLGNHMGSVSLSDLKFENLERRDQALNVSYRVGAADYAQNSGPLMLVRPRVLGEKSVAVDWKNRHLPVELNGSGYEKDVYEIELPPGFQVDDTPEPVKIDVGFAAYQSSIEVKQNVLRYTREYTVRDPEVGPDKFSQLRKLEDMIGMDEQSRAVLKRAQ